jgi:hypothetical protein
MPVEVTQFAAVAGMALQARQASAARAALFHPIILFFPVCCRCGLSRVQLRSAARDLLAGRRAW